MARTNITELREQLKSLPQKLVLELFGFKQWVQLHRFAERWRLPVGNKTTDLAVFRELRAFVTKYGAVLSALIEDLPADGSEGELGVRYLRAKIQKVEADGRMAVLRFAEHEGRLRDSGFVTSCLELLCSRARATGELARRKWGDEGYTVFREMVDGFGSDLREFIAERTARMKPCDPAIRSKTKPRRRAVAKKSKTEP